MNFLPAPLKPTYGSRLFAARSAVCDSGFYNVLHAHISELLAGSSSIAADADVLRTTALQKLEITIDVSVLVGKATATV